MQKSLRKRSQFSIPLLGILFLGLSLSNGVADEPNREQATQPTELVRLFDGTFLKETKLEDPNKVFRITDGMLHVTGEGFGGLLTKTEYRDYHCVLEFKWGKKTWEPRKEKTKDSGLLVHSVGADGGYGGIWMPSIEVQIIEGGVGDFILVSGNGKDGKPIPFSLTAETARDRDDEVIWKAGGKRETFDLKNRRRINWYGRDPDWKDVIGFRGQHDIESPDGEWTRIDVKCDGGRIEVFVNGTKVNEGLDVYPSSGRLQLQTELAEMFVRRWELYPLDKAPKPAKPKN